MSHKPPQCHFTVNGTQLNLQLRHDSPVFYPPGLLIFCHQVYVSVLFIHSEILFVSVCCHFLYRSGFCLCSQHPRIFPQWSSRLKQRMNEWFTKNVLHSSAHKFHHIRGEIIPMHFIYYVVILMFQMSHEWSSVFTESQWHEAGNTHTHTQSNTRLTVWDI